MYFGRSRTKIRLRQSFREDYSSCRWGKTETWGRLIEELCLIVEASGGIQTAAEMREQSEFRRGLAKVKAWFCSHVCLFTIVDVWVVNYIDGDKELRQIRERFTFQPREKVGKGAVDMLVHASEASREEVDEAR